MLVLVHDGGWLCSPSLAVFGAGLLVSRRKGDIGWGVRASPYVVYP